MKQRNNAIDILKGIGIILVLVAHSLGGFISQFSYTFHMPLFFIITGLFISEMTSTGSDGSFFHYWKNSVRKDFNRLVVPALFTTGVIVLVSFLFFIYPDSYLCRPDELLFDGNSESWGDSIKMLGNLWFLFALFFGKLYFYVVRQYIPERKLQLFACFMIGGIAIVSGWYFTLPFCALVGFSLLPYFGIGYIIKRRDGVDEGVPQWVWVFVVLWIVYVFYGRLHVGSMEYSWGYVLDIMAACGGTFCFYKISTLIDRTIKPIGQILAFLGRYSLVLICAPTIETYCFPFQTITPDLPFRMIFVLIGKVTWCAIAMYACLKVPFLKKVFGVK